MKAFASVAVCPSGLVTLTATAPVPAGLMAEILFGEMTMTLVADAGPNVTAAPIRKLAPVKVTAVPPELAPVDGETLVKEGGATYVKPATSLADCPSGFVTLTSAAPATPSGVTAEMLLPERTTTPVAGTRAPKVTVAPAMKFAPEIVTAVPPEVGPVDGEILVTVGAADDVTMMLADAVTVVSSLSTAVTVYVPDAKGAV